MERAKENRERRCCRCGNISHVALDFYFRCAICNFWHHIGHSENICLKKAQQRNACVKSSMCKISEFRYQLVLKYSNKSHAIANVGFSDGA